MKIFEKNTEVVFNRQVAPETYLMSLNAPEIADCSRPGQFVMVKVSKGFHPLLRRPFSICGKKDTDQIIILYRTVGSGTSLMAEIKDGDILSVLGPLGRGFDLPSPGEKPVLIGGGMGIAPLVFLSQGLEGNGFEFMAGFGSSTDVITPRNLLGLDTRVSISTDDGTEGYAGFVTDMFQDYLDKNTHGNERLSVFTCGPGPMMKRVAELTLDRNIKCQVSMEALMACGLGACQGCAVKASSQEWERYYHVCKDGPVFSPDLIDWSEI
jgi:dihydroorotate dehydrogenase electron transfer subunit